MYLVDSDRVIPFLRGRPGARDLIVSLEPQGLAISVITYAEVGEGVESGRASQGQVTGWQEFLRFVEIIPVDLPVAQTFASIRADLRSQGRLIPDMDLLIAATALSHDLTLVTGNARHFDRVPALRLYDPNDPLPATLP